MMDLTSIHSDLLNLPSDQPWGFTLYRAEYKPGSEPLWQTLIATIRTQVEEQIMGPDASRKDDPVAQQIMSRFRLDARSDVRELGPANAHVDIARSIYKYSVGGAPMNMKDKRHRLFLLADHEVLGAPFQTNAWVKCVDADYKYGTDAEEDEQLYNGFMRMTTRNLVELWACLIQEDFRNIVPPRRGGNGLPWDGEKQRQQYKARSN